MKRRLAFLGPAGTHTEEAAIAYDAAAARLPFPSITAAAVAVDSGNADQCVVPIENSLGGSVTETLDLLIRHDKLYIRRELVMQIKHNLVVVEGTTLQEVRVVYSHPQALAQCRRYLSQHLPEAELIASMSTAAAVEEALKKGRLAAAIASERASAMYGAHILEWAIEDNPDNMTRFVVLAESDHPPTGSDKTSVCFSFDEDAPGVLYSALGEFARRRINLTKIESRPTGESLGRYIFLVDLEGHKVDPLVREALSGVKSQVSTFKVFGSYPKHSRAN